jgi:RHS repeat-associated protein
LFGAILLFAFIAPAFASTPAPTVLNPTVFSLENSAPKVDGASGALTQTIQLDIPPGRNGLQPDLSLDYNSQNTAEDSEVGYGWSLSIPYIERLNKTGSQNMYGPDAYFTSSLDGELATSSDAATLGVSVLVVAGGGGGGSQGGGGGAGGLVYNSSYAIAPGTYSVTVGAGGAGAPAAGEYQGSDGSNSVFDTITAIGGGGGGGNNGVSTENGLNGGSGGGGAGIDSSDSGSGGTGTQGSDGGTGHNLGYPYNGGGGGAGGTGGDGSNTSSTNGSGGNGGSGISESITGTAVTYAGGGGGGVDGRNSGGSAGSGGSGGGGAGGLGAAGSNGTANTGGGGGGSGWNGSNNPGGNGGSGIVIVSYPTSQASNYSCGGTTTTSGSNTICTFTSNGTFTVLGGSSASDGTIYRARIDDGSFREYSYSTTTNSWTMYDKNGTEYLFGASSQSQQSATTSPTVVYKWMLDKVIDTNGNYIRYVYAKDGNQIYPSEIIYTGNGSTDGPMTITFATSTRTDPIVGFTSDFQVNTNYVISQITAAVNGSTTRQYNLSYTTGNNGYRSLLSSIQENGWDDNGTETAEPAMTFSYVDATSSFVTQSDDVYGAAYAVADTEGNGVYDVNAFYKNTFGGSNIAQINGSNTSYVPTLVWATNGGSGPGGLIPYEDGVRYIDVNGDGKSDIIEGIWNYTNSTSTDALYLNNYATSTGYAWSATTTYSGVIPAFVDEGSGSLFATTGIFGDVNGDGLPDYEEDVYNYSTGEGAYLGNGSAWDSATTTIFQPVEPMPAESTNYDSRLIDINGDGLADWEWTDGTNIYFDLNNGTGWGPPDPNYTIATSSVDYAGGTYYDRGVRFIDVNGDGLPDYVHSYSVTTSGGSPELATYSTVMLNTGSGWATSTAYTFSGYVVSGTGTTYNEFVNLNGNGQQDQDVLSTITYPKGGSTSVTYGYTTQSGTNPQLPYNLLVVTKLVNHNGQGSNEETDYSYSGGLQYLPSFVPDRKFAGFAVVAASTSQAIVKTYYSQGSTSTAAVAGDQSDGYGQLNHPYRQDTFTPSGTLVQSIFYQYNPFFHGASEFVGLTRQLEQDYASDGTHLDKDTDYEYSTSTDDLIESIDYGEVTGNSDGTFSTSSASDPRTTYFTYASPTFSSASSSTSTALSVGVLVVGGGGGGGSQGGGGGAGGVVYDSSYSITPESYTVTVGAGGSGAPSSGEQQGSNGGDSVFDTLTAYGGGGGGGGSGSGTADGNNGGSGGGGSGANSFGSGGSGDVGQGNNGGNGYNDNFPYGGGGGGAGSSGANGSNTAGINGSGGNGGSGVSNSISGSSVTYAGGGGGGIDYRNSGGAAGSGGSGGGGAGGTGGAGSNGTANTGGGGGGSGYSGSNTAGGNGGSGIVIVSYLTSQASNYTCGGSTTTSGSSTICTFTSTGTFTVTGTSTGEAYNLSVPIEKTVFNSSNATTTDTKYFYDNLPFGEVSTGNQTEEQDWLSGTHYASSTKAYNAYGLVASSTDRNGNITTYSYDSFNLYPATTTNALSQSTAYTYDYSNGKVEKTTDPNGQITLNKYDGLGRLTEIDQSDVSSPTTLDTKTTYSYTDSTSTPSLAHETDYLNSASTTDTYDYYDGLDRLIQERKSTENSGTFAVTDTTYNSAGNVASQSYPYFSSGSGNTSATTTSSLFTSYTYDPLGRVASTTDAVGTTANVYSKWTTTTTDPNGDVKDYILDAFGNLAQVVEHGSTANATTTYTYDAANNLTNITDAAGNVRNFTYDGLGDELTAQDLHASGDGTFGSWSYSYDDQGNETSRTDPDGNTITHTYDALNRMLTEALAGSSTQITDTYDSCTNGIGYICTASSTGAKITYAYDILGRVSTATTTIGGVAYPISYSYDRQGNITNLTNANGSQIAYTYNSAGLQSAVSRFSGGATSSIATIFNYAPTNALGQVVFGSGASTTYTYDPTSLYRLTNIITYGLATTTQSNTGTAISTSSIEAYWKLDGNSNDATGNGNNGSDNDITYSTPNGIINDGAGFDGSSSYITTGLSNIGSYSAGTVSAWVKFSSLSNDTFIGDWDVYPGHILQEWVDGTNLNCARGDTGTNALSSYPVSNLSTGVWYNIVCTFSISGGVATTQLYVNGAAVGTNTPSSGGSIETGSKASAIGADFYNGSWGGFTDGDIDEVGVWSRVLTSGEITALYNSGAGIQYPFTVSTGTTTRNVELQNLTYHYDADGNITSRTDNSDLGLGQVVSYTYDDLNRLTSASTTVNNTNLYDQTYTYDSLGNLLTGPTGTYSYQGNTGSSYADPDAVTQTVLTTGASSPTIAYDNSAIAGNGTPASSLTFSYTDNNNTDGIVIVAVQEAPPTGSCSTDKVTGVTDNGTSLTDAGYYIGNTSPVDGALKTYYGYAPAQGTHNIVVSASASCILYATAATYTGVKQSGFPDASGSGNPLNDSGAVTLFQATTTTANNNAWAILVGVPSQSGTATAGANTTIRQQQSGDLYYADSNGPVSPAGSIGLNWTMPSATHWVANYFSITPVVSNPGVTSTSSYAYDSNGNLTSVTTGATTTYYGYDYLNRLTSISVNGAASTTYGYDWQGNRVFQQTGSTTTVYPSKWYSVVTVSAATSTGTSTEYIYLPAQAGGSDRLLATVDQPLVNGAPSGTSTVRYIHTDNLGSTAITSDVNGNLAQSFDYAPYGSVLASTNTGTTTATRQYIGQYSDASGLSYFQNRYYQPAQGQFLTEDPAFLELGNAGQLQQITAQDQQSYLADPQQLNAYSYSQDNPITKSDPSGKQVAPIILGAMTVYGVAMWGIDLYDYDLTHREYPQVFTPAEKAQSTENLAYSTALLVTGESAGEVGLPAFGKALDVLSTSQDVVDEYWGPQAYEYYNQGQEYNSASVQLSNWQNVNMTPSPTISTYNNYRPTQTTQNQGQAAQGSGSSSELSQLVQSLSNLANALSSLVSSLSGKSTNAP